MLYFVKAQWLPSKVGSMPIIYQWLMIAAFISLCFIMTVLPRSVLGLVMCRIAGREPRGVKIETHYLSAHNWGQWNSVHVLPCSVAIEQCHVKTRTVPQE